MTVPVLLIDAMVAFELLHAPLVELSDKVVVLPVHKVVVPVIVPDTGKGFTVMVSIAIAVPQLFVTL